MFEKVTLPFPVASAVTFPFTFPFSVAVIVPAVKSPLVPRITIVFAEVPELVAVVAELETFPAVEIVASFVSTIAAVSEISEFLIDVPRLSLEYSIAAFDATFEFDICSAPHEGAPVVPLENRICPDVPGANASVVVVFELYKSE